MISSRRLNQLLRGRRITKIKVNPFSTGRGSTAHKPQIYLDDGSSLRFMVIETDVGEYGIEVNIIPPRPNP